MGNTERGENIVVVIYNYCTVGVNILQHSNSGNSKIILNTK